MRKAFNGVFGGLFNASHLTADLQEQQSACESYFMDLEGQMKGIQDSFRFRMFSWLLPKRNENSEGGIGNVPILQRLLSSFPVVGGFWQSRQDLQMCHLKVQTMERKLETLKTDLKPFGILGKFLPDFVTGTEGGTIVPQMRGGNWFRVAVVGMIVAGNVLLWKLWSTKEEEKELEELGENIQLEMEKQIEFLDRELESAWEEVHSRCQVESKLEEEKKELKAEIQRLSNTMETLQKDKENEIDHFSTKMQDLQLTNEQLKNELSNKDIAIGDHLDKLTEKDQKILRLTEKLGKVHEENEARIKRESKLEEEIEDLKVDTLGLSHRIETLHMEKGIETEKFSTKLQELQKTNDHLNEELSNKDASIGEYPNKSSEMEQINLDKSEQLARVEDEKIASIHWLESRFEDKIVEFEEIIREMKTEKERLEMSLTEARVNDLVRNGRYNCLLEELKGLKEEYSNKFSEMEQKNLEMSEELEKLEGEKVASIHGLESVFEKEIDELEDTIEKQLGIIGEMNKEKERLEMSLTEAKMKHLTNEGNYTCLVNVLKDTKKEASRAKDKLSKALEEIDELKESMVSIAKERDSLKEHVSHLSSSKQMAEERIVQITKENVGLKDELLAANEITSSLKEELEGRDKKKEQTRPGTRKVRLDRSGLEILT
ncbi:myosin heavy chain, clone 203-like [Palaemon carinicauda]|uniref:myosin heavy chain, clone 203-like n=1 Tax=Palaemon carinicauda TaxID=392227 RepID=UPI0035B5ABA9